MRTCGGGPTITSRQPLAHWMRPERGSRRVCYFLIAGYLIYCILGAQISENKAMQQILDGM